MFIALPVYCVASRPSVRADVIAIVNLNKALCTEIMALESYINYGVSRFGLAKDRKQLDVSEFVTFFRDREGKIADGLVGEFGGDTLVEQDSDCCDLLSSEMMGKLRDIHSHDMPHLEDVCVRQADGCTDDRTEMTMCDYVIWFEIQNLMGRSKYCTPSVSLDYVESLLQSKSAEDHTLKQDDIHEENLRDAKAVDDLPEVLVAECEKLLGVSLRPTED